MILFRCDDLPQDTSMEVIADVYNSFAKKKQVLIFSILASQLDRRPDFVSFVNNNPTNIALHGWTHESYPIMKKRKIREHIKLSLEAFNKHFGVLPEKWYLPWNGWVREYQAQYGDGFYGVEKVGQIAKEYGLEVCLPTDHIGALLNGQKPKEVYFHAWDKEDIKKIPKVLGEL